MARVTIVFEDAEQGRGGMEKGISVFIESADPPIPLKGNDVDPDQLTPAQAAMRMCLGELLDQAGFAELFTEKEDKPPV